MLKNWGHFIDVEFPKNEKDEEEQDGDSKKENLDE